MDQCPPGSRIVKQRVVAMAVGWAPNRLKAGPNGSGVNRLDTDDILAPHTPTKAPSNGSDCVLAFAGDRGFESQIPLQVFLPEIVDEAGHFARLS